ncbi:hypothetical protein GCM10010412_053260 [Nonomuraea recticatena]|uniref:Cytoplasmic protein n=1 Tax=Nonomuraea recticatena TaxID=46178 RepID=A0ABN3SF78_9ACTN
MRPRAGAGSTAITVSEAGMSKDPAVTNPELYKVIFENDRVRVLEYRDRPGDRTVAHQHPDSVMYTLSSFRRKLSAGGREVAVELPAGQVRWLDAQEHSGENIGDTETHSIFIELKEPGPAKEGGAGDLLGPSAGSSR